MPFHYVMGLFEASFGISVKLLSQQACQNIQIVNFYGMSYRRLDLFSNLDLLQGCISFTVYILNLVLQKSVQYVVAARFYERLDHIAALVCAGTDTVMILIYIFKSSTIVQLYIYVCCKKKVNQIPPSSKSRK